MMYEGPNVREPADRIRVTIPGFGSALRSIRKYEHRSIADVAGEALVHEDSLMRWENEKTIPDLQLFLAVVNELGYHLEMVEGN